ncbi:TonB-dependent siderophore receptor [Phyllobacterium endophyticum]|uniref:TonB-dependent siderophore receptor n=1 Tax=Phyllobacterium endophyticum TaxID=1149773 RepID=A0A2P7B1Z0_9HYPH|nr:TonB-dependent receptor [Phyllobacterium endophyticum]MBB3238055.1 iron complex outermembrane receptor protein [Phyllobacterium endophyticum]PSH60468.1 hypothetical protein CU100_07275 [Phyllobacterium endophyticum]TYR42645.1 TonB-dependent receptor [Phyllobacterium endophyticum]
MPINTAAVHTDIFKKFRTFRKSAVISVSALALALAGGAANSQEVAKPAKTTASPTKNKVRKASTTSADELPTITVTDKAGGGDVNAGQNDKGFVAEGTSSATFTNTPLSEIPKSVQIVTKDLIKSQQARSVVEAVRNVSGVFVDSNQSIQIRNFTASVLTNGDAPLSLTGTMAGTIRPMAGVARVEVLKGADALIGGPMAPSGIVNVILKRPQKEPLREFTIEGGSFGHLKSSIDMTGPVTDDKNLTYRMVLSGERDRENFGGYDGTAGGYIAPSLDWSNGGTDVLVGGELYKMRAPISPTAFLGPDGVVAPTGFVGNRQEGSDIQGGHVYADVEHHFDNGLIFSAKADYQQMNLDIATYRFVALPLYFPFRSQIESSQWSIDSKLTGELDTGPLGHTITMGGRYAKSNEDIRSARAAPLFYTDPQLPPVPSSLPIRTEQSTEKEATRFFIQDQIKWGKITLLASIAHNGVTINEDPSKAWTPNLGVSVQVTDDVAVYSSWQHSFRPQDLNPLYHFDGALPPETGETIEAGVKVNLLDDRLFLTGAVFRTESEGGWTTDSEGEDPTKVILTNKTVVSQGVELDVSGEFAAGWNVSANYSFSKINRGGEGDSSLKEYDVHLGSAWVSYDIQDGRWQGLGAALGVTARSEVPNHLKYVVPAQAGVDANIHWKSDKASLTLGVKNLLNSRLYSTDVASNFVNLEPARTILLTGTVQF